ncbi:MAG: excinuclease ABC subunit UvrA [Hyphomicrobiales bacterium]
MKNTPEDSQLLDIRHFISVKGAREHNLKNINIDLPRDKLIVFTGLSGSGKSSLAFDTIYAEGQRRYVESLSAYARQFLQMMQKPDVDQIDGLSPAISIEQKTTSKNPRSTVGTVTEIYDYLRLLYARIGIPYSPTTGLPITSQSVSQMVDKTMELPDKTRLFMLAPIVRGRKGEFKDKFAELQKKGFTRLKIDGQFYEVDELPELNKKLKHDVDVVIDRIVIREGMSTRLADSFETALSLTEGLVVLEYANIEENEKLAKRIVFSSKFACPVSGFTIEEIEPRLFSFNNPFGACPSCDGLGTEHIIDPNLVVPDGSLSLADGAIAAWSKTKSFYYVQTLENIARHYKFSMKTAFNKLPQEAQDAVLFGTGKTEIKFVFKDEDRHYERKKTFEGVVPNLERRWRETDSSWSREEIEKYQTLKSCKKCNGQRLKPEALAVKIDNLHITEISSLSIKDAVKWFNQLEAKLSSTHLEIGVRVLKEIRDRLHFLNNVGLDYLSLSRNSGTLSGGESQRIRLASQIGSGLTGVLYVLDEPSIGLHQRDNERLLETLVHLRDLGNTVIVVEHDEDAIMAADHVVDIGPGAGIHGGEIVAQGSPEDILKSDSLTAQYLTGRLEVRTPTKRRKILKSKQIKVVGATGNNLKNVTASIPLKNFTCITGVSGSGKSTFLIETLYKTVSKTLNRGRKTTAPHKAIEGIEQLDKIIDINQSPIGRTPRSNPATYTGAFGPIRDWFAGLPESKARGYKPGRFSFNVKGGRCENCRGDGLIKIEMHFLPDVYVTCEDCEGKRYNRETLEILYKGHSIADILDMTVEKAASFFQPVPNIRDKMVTLNRVGLGYIKVGQQATTLSGGEAQRVKLAKELSKRATGKTLYILDEPTTGLHFHDIAKLLEVLHELVDQGNSIVVIEHNLEVIKTADWIIDFGPEGGDGGGEVVAMGRPEDIIDVKESYTGKYLKPLLEK